MTRQVPRFVTVVTSTASATTTVLSRGGIKAGDLAVVSPFNTSAAALYGNSAGVYAVCTTGSCTITSAESLATEQFVVAVYPLYEPR
jgi:hypothetical protein